MTIQQLEYIVDLDTYRHFVTAAEKCFVTQPTLTIQVQKLEDEIGIQIFDRSKKPLKPTNAGEQILIKARQIIREINQLKEFVSNEKESISGNFTIGIIPTLAPYLIPLFLPHFIHENKSTKLKIIEVQSKDIIEGIKKDTMDIGILSTPLDENSIREIPVFYEPFILYLPENHEYTKQEKIDANTITTKNILLLNEGHCFREQILNICRQSREHGTLRFDYESGSLEALKRLVKMGIGYTLVPELAIDYKTEARFLRKFSKPVPTREISLAVNNTFTKERLLEQLRKSILENIPDYFTKKKITYR